MQFETKLVNGRPGIFYNNTTTTGTNNGSNRNDKSKAGILKNKLKAKDKRLTQKLRDSVDISGEIDSVKFTSGNYQSHQTPGNSRVQQRQSPPPKQQPQQQRQQNKKTTAANNDDSDDGSIVLSQSQLLSIINAIQSDGAQVEIDDRGRIKLLNAYRQSQAKQQDQHYDDYNNVGSNQNYNNRNYDDFVATVRKPNIVVADDDDDVRAPSIKSLPPPSTSNYQQQQAGGSSLMDKKKQKWQEERNMQERLLQQELESKQKLFNTNNDRTSMSQMGGGGGDGQRGGLSLMEKKRLKWQQEKDENQVINNSSSNHALMGGHQQQGQQQLQMQKSISLNNLNYIDSLAHNRPPTNDQNHALYEKKKLKWANDTQDDTNGWNPFGRPGGGAPNRGANQNDDNLSIMKNINNEVSYRQSQPNLYQPQSHQQQQQHQQYNEVSTIQTRLVDQSKVPAAMRTSVFFGDVKYEDDVKKTKELERKKWLMELEMQKKEKLIEKEFNKERERLNDLKQELEATGNQRQQPNQKPPQQQSAYQQQFQQSQPQKQQQPAYQQQYQPQQTPQQSGYQPQYQPQQQYHQQQPQHQMSNIFSDKPPLGDRINFETDKKEPKTFLRTTNHLLDPAQIEELERKKKLNLQHQRDIEAQIAEKKRLKQIDDQTEAFENIKFENELKTTQLQQQIQQQQQQLNTNHRRHNFGENSNRDKENMSTIMGTSVKPPPPVQANTTAVMDSEKRLLQAEFDATHEKSTKLLAKLQKGGHDTSKLKAKINEYKAKYRVLGVNVGEDLYIEGQEPPSRLQSYQGQQPQRIMESKLDSDRSYGNYQPQQQPPQQQQFYDEAANEQHRDGGARADQARIKQIFNLMRDDTNGNMPELTNEQIQMLLKSVAKNADTSNKGNKGTAKPPTQQGRPSLKQTPNTPPKATVKVGERPKWGQKNTQVKKNVPNSHKDPFFNEKQLEKKTQEIENLKRMLEASNRRPPQYAPPPPQPQQYQQQYGSDDVDYDDYEVDSRAQPPPVPQVAGNQRAKAVNGKNSGEETIFNLLNNNKRNLKSNDIDEDEQSTNFMIPTTNTQRRLRQSTDSYKSGFVPFLRTDEILNPAHAASPCPPSRESTATKHNRDKARKGFEQNMRPADYGHYENNGGGGGGGYDGDSRNNKMKDPLYNHDVVKKHPTPRQDTILSQLANLKQNLVQKQKEVASSIHYNDYM